VPGTTQLSVLDQQHEGITMDDNGFIYMVAENGGGDINNPELWVYAPVPEPGPLSLMLAGLGAIGFVVGRRNAKVIR
jgi:PEP-CTERM motif